MRSMLSSICRIEKKTSLRGMSLVSRRLYRALVLEDFIRSIGLIVYREAVNDGRTGFIQA